jgi:HxlR-like helix-turn-helix protein
VRTSSARSGRRSSSTTSPKARADSRSSSTRARASRRGRSPIVARHSYPESPPRVEYELTGKGEALLPIIDAMRDFGHSWLAAAD